MLAAQSRAEWEGVFLTLLARPFREEKKAIEYV